MTRSAANNTPPHSYSVPDADSGADLGADPGLDLAERLAETIATAKAGTPFQRVTVVTPGYFSSFYLRRWLARNGLLNVEFVRIEDLADLLAQAQISEHGGRSLSRLEGAELVRNTVAESAAAGDLTGPFSELANQPAFLAALQRTLRDLEAEAGAGPVSFSKLSNPGEITRTVGKTWDVYQRLKSEQKLFDRTQVSSWAVDALDSGALETSDAQLSVGKLVVIAATTPAPQYRKLWRVIVSLPDSHVLTATTGDEHSDIALADAFGISPPGQPATANTPPYPLPSIVSAADTRSEISALIQRIAEAAATGTPLNRIAVLSNDPAYAARARSALKLANIPVSGPPQEPLLTSPAGRFVDGILKIASTDLARPQLGDWLATGPVQHPESRKPVTGTAWDRISKAARVTGGMDRWKQRLGNFAQSKRFRADAIERHGEDDSSTDGGGGIRATESLRSEAQSAEDLLAFIEALAIDLEPPGVTASWPDWKNWSGWLDRLIDRYLHAPQEPGATNSRTANSAERIKILLKRIGELDSLRFSPGSGRFGPTSSPNLSRFAAVVSRELSETRSGANRLGKGVFVANVRDAAATRFDHVHILGMADGTFPSPDTADPLLPDAVREELNGKCGIGLQLSGVRKDLRRRQFLAALISGSRATLYWSRSSGPGRSETGPAQWLIEQARRHPGNESLQAGDLLKRPETLCGVSIATYGTGPGASDIHEYEIASVRNHVQSRQSAAKHWLESDTRSGVPAALSLERERYGKTLSPWSGGLSSVASDVPSVSGEVLSASRIETFAACPLRYLFGYVLKVDPGVREDDSFHMAPDRRGTFIHSVLETYLNLRIADDRPPGGKTMDEAMGVVTADWRRKEPDAVGRIWELDTIEIRRQLRRWLAREATLEAGGFTPSDAELSFGRGSGHSSDQGSDRNADDSLSKLEITLEDGEVLQFGGVIDRVDRHDDGSYYVLDYKTGNPRFYSTLKDDPVDRGKHLQLALYSKAVQQFRSPERSPVAGYWFVGIGKERILPEPDSFDPELAERRLRDVLETLQATSRSGQFPPNPGDRRYGGGSGDSFENCTYCDFNRVCPASSRRERMFSDHKTDPRLAPYFDLALARDAREQEVE